MIKRINSLQTSLLLHELSFILLIVITASIGIAWSSSWQTSAQESLRIGAMNTAVQNIRGDVYRQLKEVFDGSFLSDVDADEEYRDYTVTINAYLKQLQGLAIDRQEVQMVGRITHSYVAFYEQTVSTFSDHTQRHEQAKHLDASFESQTLVELEAAFIDLSALINTKQIAINDAQERWTSKLIIIATIPILLSIALLIAARRYIKKNIVTPLSSLMDGAKLISKGQLEHSVAEEGVSELVRLAAAINKMAAELIINRDTLVESKKQAALGELIPLVAHNIRNPLAGIRAAAQVASDDASEQTRDTLSDIIIAVDRLERWVTSLLSYLHPVKPHLTEARLVDVADNALSLIELQLHDKNVSLVRQGWESINKSVLVDVTLFEQVIFNLVQNALEASTSTKSITLRYEETATQVKLLIEDQGRGMKFDPASETVIQGETKRHSCGLGIPFSIKVIKQHGGDLHYQRVDSGGTRVVITLKPIG